MGIVNMIKKLKLRNSCLLKSAYICILAIIAPVFYYIPFWINLSGQHGIKFLFSMLISNINYPVMLMFLLMFVFAIFLLIIFFWINNKFIGILTARYAAKRKFPLATTPINLKYKIYANISIFLLMLSILVVIFLTNNLFDMLWHNNKEVLTLPHLQQIIRNLNVSIILAVLTTGYCFVEKISSAENKIYEDIFPISIEKNKKGLSLFVMLVFLVCGLNDFGMRADGIKTFGTKLFSEIDEIGDAVYFGEYNHKYYIASTYNTTWLVCKQKENGKLRDCLGRAKDVGGFVGGRKSRFNLKNRRENERRCR